MMLSRADFEELFPEMFKQKESAVNDVRLPPNDACIDRWKEDGGLVLKNSKTTTTSDSRSDKTNSHRWLSNADC